MTDAPLSPDHTPTEPPRLCQRPGCGGAAVATVTTDYRGRVAAVGPLRPAREGEGVDLCAQHRDRFTPPRGWEVLRYDPHARSEAGPLE